MIIQLNIALSLPIAQSTRAVEYTNCFSGEG